MSTLTEAIKTYIDSRLQNKLEAHDKTAEASLAKAGESEREQETNRLQGLRRALVTQYSPINWLTDAAKRASQIKMVTHAAKYTHSDTKSSGVFLTEPSTTKAPTHISSYCYSPLPADVTGNAAALDVAGLLLLQHGKSTLLDEIKCGDSPSLRALAENNDTLYKEWLQGFQTVLQATELRSGQLSKQLYFPIKDGGYHLISPLFASSLTHVLHERINSHLFSDTAKEARDARRKKLPHPSPVLFFPSMAIQSFGGTKPQNISRLNTQRYGRAYLFSAQPPVWKKQPFLPVSSKEAFWKEYERRSYPLRLALQAHLAKHFGRTSALDIRTKRSQLVDEFIDLLWLLAADIQQQTQRAGWSKQSKIPWAEQLWLDPYRATFDEEFATERSQGDWQASIARRFALQLNQIIDNANTPPKKKHPATLKTGEDEFNEWHKLVLERLRLFTEDLEVMA